MTRVFALILFVSVIHPRLYAEPPVAEYLFPAGGQRGTTVPVQVGGLHLTTSCQVELIGTGVHCPPQIHRTTTRWFEGPLLPLPESQRPENYPKAMACPIQIAADAALGVRHLVLSTSQGITTPLKFIVGSLPELIEDEQPGIADPVAITLPMTVNGRIFPREDVDIWSVHLKSGESLTASVAAAHGLGSPLEARLELRDFAGRKVAEALPTLNRDAMLTYLAPATGVYQLHIRDIGFQGGPAYVYRLTVITGPWIEFVSPLGGQRGQNVRVKFHGTAIHDQEKDFPIPADSPEHVLVPNEQGQALLLEVDGLPEVDDASRPIPVPGIANGRIKQPGARERWSFHARAGIPIQVELHATRLGSPLLGQLQMEDAEGKLLAQAQAVAASNSPNDASLVFLPAKDGQYFVEVSDQFRNRGGPAFQYRLKLTHPQPGFELLLASPTATVERLAARPATLKITVHRKGGFTGAISLRAVGLPAGVSIPEKFMIPPNQAQVNLPIQANDSAPIGTFPIRLIGTGWINTPLTSAALPIEVDAVYPVPRGEPRFPGLKLAVAIPTPFKIVGDFVSPLHPRGTRLVKRYRVERNGYDGPITVELAEQQARHLQGVTGPVITVPAGAKEFDYPVDLPPWMDMGRTCRVCVMGSATMTDHDGRSHVVSYSSRHQNDQIIAIIEPGRLSLELDVPSIVVAPGETHRIAFTVTRAKGLTGPVQVGLAESLPGLTATPVTVEPSATGGELEFRFSSDAGDGVFRRREPVTVRARMETASGPVVAEAALAIVVRQVRSSRR